MYLALINESVHGTHRLLHWRAPEIRSMTVDNVDRVQLQTLQRSVHTLDDVLSGQSVIVGEAVSVTKVELRRDDIVVAFEIALLQSLAHDDLTLALGVNFSRVEEIDSMVPCFLQALCRLFDLRYAAVRAIREPAAEAEYTDLEAGAPEVAEEHVLGLEALALLWISLIRHGY